MEDPRSAPGFGKLDEVLLSGGFDNNGCEFPRSFSENRRPLFRGYKGIQVLAKSMIKSVRERGDQYALSFITRNGGLNRE